MRNAVQRRNHKERAQPIERQKWGLLEKRKDYKLRAADHRLKNAKLKILAQKARDRNPDEFSFKMMSSKVDGEGKKVADRGNKALSLDVVKLLKTQDAGYIRTMLQMVRREIQDLGQKLVLENQHAVRTLKDGGRSQKSEHRVFVEDEEQQQQFDSDLWLGQGQNLPGRQTSALPKGLQAIDASEDEIENLDLEPRTPKKKQIEAEKQARRHARKFEKDRERAQSTTATRLASAKKREHELMAAEAELEIQRAKMSSTVGGVNKNGVKFKIRERKR